MIKEIDGYFTCTLCGYEWSAMLGDDEIKDKCICEENKNWNLSTYSHFSSKLFSNSFTFYSLHSANTMDVICDFRNIKLF